MLVVLGLTGACRTLGTCDRQARENALAKRWAR
jgi:hypothetical protein